MDMQKDVVDWLKTLKKSYRLTVAKRADVNDRYLIGLIGEEYADPKISKLQRLWDVMQEDLKARLGHGSN